MCSPVPAVARPRMTRPPSVSPLMPRTADPTTYASYASYAIRLLDANALGDTYVRFADLLRTGATAADRFGFARRTLSSLGLLPAAVHAPEVRRRQLYDADVSRDTRLRGNEHFAQRRYGRALDVYTECLLITEPGTECYALALANRSAALYRLDEYRLCLDDVRRALRAGYPARGAHKLYERAGDAQRALGRGDAAARNYVKCLKYADRPCAAELLDADGARRLRARVEDAVRGCRDPEATAATAAAAAATARERGVRRTSSESGGELSGVDHLPGGRDETVPAFSDRLVLGLTADGAPRGVYADRDIEPGDVVAVDHPYVCGPSPYYNSICHYGGCMKPSVAIIPCPKCSLAYYCNEVCLQKAFKDGHNIECAITFSIRTIPGNPYLNELALKWFVKECTKMGIKNYCSLINNLDKSKIDTNIGGFDENGQFKSDNFLAAYSMKNSVDSTPLDTMLFFHFVAVDILEYLMLSGFEIPECYIATAGASIVHMLCVLDFNCRKLFVNNPSLNFRALNDVAFPIAYALYPSLGLFNHSCDPNVKLSGLLSDKMRVLRAIRPIPKGSQLLISYGVVFNLDTIDARLSYCMDNFQFECICQPCRENWPFGRFIPERISSLNLINPKMADIVTLECKKFIEFKKTTRPDDLHKHLNYLNYFNKFICANVKRPFQLYEDCLLILSTAYTYSSKNDLRLFSQVFQS